MVSLGDFDMAIDLLRPVLARAQRQNLTWFASDSTLDPIRTDSRYQTLVDQAEARLAAST